MFARRLQSIIDKLIGHEQSAYIKGRFIGENARLILDIYEYCENMNQEGILMFLDFEKAFDSAEWNFLFKTLKKFNFGDNFISWMKILYTKPVFRLKNNGWISRNCSMFRGIRQGCPISALLYIFVAEILAIKLKKNENISGFTCSNMNKEIKNVQHADDLTMALKDIDSLRNTIETVNNFCMHAGSKINISKTECILLGPLKGRYRNIEGINVTDKAVKCLGIYLGHDKIECYNKNWMKIYHDTEKLFESWKKRKLSLFGKCCVVNTLALSKLIYIASILTFPDSEYIKKFNKLIYNFIWNKRDRIKRNSIIGSIDNGGIGIVDIETKMHALKASWVSRIVNSKQNLYDFVNSFCTKNNISIDYLLKTNENTIDDYTLIRNMPTFYQEMFVSFNKCKKEIPCSQISSDNFLQQPLWNNRYICYKGKSLCYTKWIKKGILYVKDIFDENGNFRTLEYLSTMLTCKANWLCEYHTLFNIFRKFVRKFDFSNAKYINIKMIHAFLFHNAFHPINNQKCKFFYENLLKKKFQKPIYQSVLSKEFHIEDRKLWQNIYCSKIKDIFDKSVAEFNYKLLNNILNNNYMVSKWNKEVQKYCSVCFTQVENSRHLIYECRNVVQIWNIVRATLNFDVNWIHIILGFYYENTQNVRTLNNLISYIACRIYKRKMFCRLENLPETEYSILNDLKASLRLTCSVIRYGNIDINVETFKRLFNNL